MMSRKTPSCASLLQNTKREEGAIMKNEDLQKIQSEVRERYLDGLKRYKERGIAIVIDGQVCDEVEWGKIFQVCEDGSFYMSDYIGADTGKLTEIHFDKVYYK